MCGAYTILTYADKEEIRRFLQEIEERLGSSEARDIRPTDLAPALLAEGESSLKGDAMRFGFPGFKGGPTIINARSETIAEKNTFRDAIRNRRCVLPAGGYYEWTGTKKQKTRHLITLTESSEMYLAGCYNSFHTPHGDELRFVIVTTEPNPDVISIHNRMPVVLNPAEAELWLYADYSALYDRQHVRLTVTPPEPEGLVQIPLQDLN